MFTAEEFKRINRNCPNDLDDLLMQLSIPRPVFDEKFDGYDKLDADIVDRLCRALKAKTIMEGCTRLINIGGQRVTSDEDEDDVIIKSVNYEKAIMKGAKALPPPELPVELQRPIYVEETVVAMVPMLFGATFSTMTFAYTLFAEMYFPAITVMGAFVGLAGLYIGFKGETRLRKVDLPKPPEDEPEVLNIIDVRKSLDTLKIINKIINTM